MGRFTIFSNVNDAFLRSSSINVFNAQEGDTGVGLDPAFIEAVGGSELHFGQKYEFSNGGTYVTEALQEWEYTQVPTTHRVTSAALHLPFPIKLPTGDQWDAEMREHDWGGGENPTTADWVPGSDLPEKVLLAHFPEIRTKRPAPSIWRSGKTEMRVRMTQPSPMRTVLNSNKTWLGFAAGGNGDEWVAVGSFEGADGPSRPRVEVSTLRKSVLARAMNGQVQLSDGTVAYLEFTGDVLTLKHDTSTTTPQTVATIGIGLDVTQFKLQDGANAFSLTRDSLDNLYVVGPAGAELTGLQAQAFQKGAGYSWNAKAAQRIEIAYYDEGINQTSVAWHQVGAAQGYLAVVLSHTQGHLHGNQTLVVSLRCSNLLAGSGAALAAQVDMLSGLLGAPVNHTGGGLDILAVSGGAGVMGGVTFDHGASPNSEADARLSVYRYVISSTGSFSTAPARVWSTGTSSTVTADGEIRGRLIPVSSTRFVLLAGSYIMAFTMSGTTVTINGQPRNLAQAGLATFGNDYVKQCDGVFDPASNRVWVYYLDAANSRRVMRTGYNIGSSLLTLEETQVATNTGASGSSNITLRCSRGPIDERRVNVHLANLAGDAVTHTLVQVEDTGLNQAPTAPVLNPVNTFNAAAAKLVSWTFSDPNPRDQQSAYQIQIRDQSSGTLVYDSNKITTPNHAQSFTIAANTLSNNEAYEWRVRTYDDGDNVSAYSAYAAFTTTTTGVVTITSPAEDNPPGIVSPNLNVTWTFTAGSGATQARYRVTVIRVDSGVTLLDTGYVSSTDTRTFTVQGLLSDVEQQIEVRVEDSAGLLSNTATRRITPVFSGPDQPTVLVQPNSDQSGVEVTVVNPTPTGDLPSANLNLIQRAIAGSGTFITVGQAFPNDVFEDYGVASDTLYDYRVLAVAEGRTASGITEDISIRFYGLYLHDPLDPAGTLRYLPFGGTNKSEDVTSSGTELRFHGRQYPVFEFGEQLSEKVNFTIQTFDREDIDYIRDVARSRRVYCYRDGRGRRVFGVLDSAGITDIPGDGFDVTLTVVRADFSEELT